MNALTVTDLLFAALVLPLTLLIDATEVGDDDRDWKSDDQHATQRTDAANDLPGDRLRYHVTVSVAHTPHILHKLSNTKQEAQSLLWKPIVLRTTYI